MEPTGEAQERETPTHMEAHKNGRVGGETAHVVGTAQNRVRWRALVDDLYSIRKEKDK